MRYLPLLLLVACTEGPVAASRLDRVPTGAWGGAHVRLSVTETGGTIEFDCAHGSLASPLTLDADGRFDIRGTLVGEGGPTRKDDAEASTPARYHGSSDEQKMQLEVTLDDGSSAGAFSLVKGGVARLVKCR